ncbi:MAG: TonB-dependent receptor [Halioglobus sp.]
MKSSMSHAIKLALAGFVGAAAVSASSANAQLLEEIVVTSQYREAGLQDVPISVVAVTSELMLETNVVKIEDLTTLVPNFTYGETGITTAFLIRGIGSGVNQGFEQSVGVYVDGVHYPRGQQVRTPFLDLERVEVLRGPQSILFGKNSVAGAINTTTAKPTSVFEGSLLASHEFEDEENIVEAMLSGPLSSRVRARVAARYRDFEGFITNATLDRIEPEREETTVRATLEVDVTESLLATFKAEVSDFDSDGRAIEIHDPQRVDNPLSPFNGLTYGEILAGPFGQDPSVLNQTEDGIRSSNGDFSYNETETFQLTLNWDLGGFELQSNSAYQTLKYDEVCDCDFTGGNVFLTPLHEDYEQFSQEIRLTSPAGDRFQYIVGAYYQQSEHEYADEIQVNNTSVLIGAANARSPGAGNLIAGTQAAREANVDATVLSAFVQFDWNIAEDLTLQLGGRVTQDDKDGERMMDIEANRGGALPAEQSGAPLVYAALFGITSRNLEALADLDAPGAQAQLDRLGEGQVAEQNRKTTKFSPDIKLVWDYNDDVMLYASWARGFKSGGFDFRANNKGLSSSSAAAFEFDDEEATNYELGGKFKLGDSAEINATLYFTEFDDLQVSIFDGVVGFNVGNAASSEVKGLELDGRWAINENVYLTGSFAYTDFEFTDFENGQCYGNQARDGSDPRFNPGTGFCDYAGLKNSLVSDYSGNIGVNFDYGLLGSYELSGLVNIFYASSYEANQANDPAGEQEGFSKLDVRLGFGPQNGRWELALLGKNLTDEVLKTFTSDAPLSGPAFGANTNESFFTQGRTIALQARMNF